MDTKKYNNKNLIVLITVVGFFCLNLLPFLSTVRPVMYDESWYVHIPEHTHPLIPVELSLQEQQ
jgi:hypothetical protein